MRCLNTLAAGFRCGACRIGRSFLGLTLAAASTATWAQTVTYGPAATAIPTLGGGALILLSALMILAFWQMRKRGLLNDGGGRFMVFALATGILVSAAGGVKLVADAYANGGLIVSLNNASGGTVPLDTSTTNCLRNETEVTQEILAINPGAFAISSNAIPDGDCYEQGNSGPTASLCTVGTQLQKDVACGILLQN
ncbi:MAG: midcut-by-XrtH protein [Parahaliea sp.]